MEVKKNKKYDLEPKRSFFFGIGMLISLAFTITAFEWRTEVEPIITCKYEPEPYIIIQTPVTKVPEPPKPKSKRTPIKVTETREELTEAAKELIPKEEPVANEPFEVPEMPEEPAEEAPVNYASTMPSYEGGMSAFYTFIADNIEYPKRAQLIGAEGRVFVKFIVEKDGSLTDIHVIKGIGSGCDKEAVRVLRMANKFRPGKQGNRQVRVQMIVPINFRLY